MTIQVKLFITTNYIEELEKQMNDFLLTLQDEQVKKIYVALTSNEFATRKMGLVEYKEKETDYQEWNKQHLGDPNDDIISNKQSGDKHTDGNMASFHSHL